MAQKLQTYIRRKGGVFSRGGMDVMFFTFLLLIVAIGLIMLYSASYVYAYNKGESGEFFFRKQLIWALVGLAVMYALSRVNYRLLEDIGALGGTAAAWLLLLLALVMPAHNGTRRHIYIGGLQFQPSDVAKFTLILTLAAFLSKYHAQLVSKRPLNKPWANAVNGLVRRPVINQSFFPVGMAVGIIGIYAGLIFAGSHLSGTILTLTIGVIMLFLGEVSGKWFALGGAAGAALIAAASRLDVLKGYMEERVYAWVHKDFDPLGVRWQTNQALIAIGSGGLFGKGLGQSTMKHMYVSEPQNDMIFSIVVEELGLIGAALILALFALLIWRGVVIGINARTRYGALLALGVVFQLGVQVVLNILVATDSIPNTGISLPFFSYGGTAIVVTLAEMGVVLGVSRDSRLRRR